MRGRKASVKIKRKIHNQYILPVMTYGCETSHGYLITVGPSEQQSEPQDFGPENRVVQKQGEETISPDSLDPYGED